jgi:hypothetical protein
MKRVSGGRSVGEKGEVSLGRSSVVCEVEFFTEKATARAMER